MLSGQPDPDGRALPIQRGLAPRILYVTPFWPHRATSASELRSLHVGRALQELGTVRVVVVDAEGDGQGWAELPEKEFDVAYGVPVTPRPNKCWRQKLAWAVNPRIHYPHGCGVDRESLDRILQTAAHFDLIWFFKLRTANMFPRWAWTRSVVDIDDVPSSFERSVQRTTTRLSDWLLTGVRVISWRRRDSLLGDRFTVLGVCSEADRTYLNGLGVTAPMHIIPNGFEHPRDEPIRRPSTPPRIGFVGILDYPPNLAGIQWFASHCWPRIKHQVPDARLRIMGRYSDGSAAPAGTDIEGLGWVLNATEEISTWSAMIVPILTGAGTRGKIAHAFSLKCPVVSTSLGAHGYDVTDGREMYLADSSADFADACVRAMRRPEEAAALAERAWQQYLRKWTWDAIRPRIWAAAEQCLELSRRTRGSFVADEH